MKRTLLVTTILLLSLAASAYDAQIDGIYYNLSGSKATVTYKNTNYNSYSGSVVIPETVTYNGLTYSVSSIGDYAFSGCYSLTSITIPNSVTSIGWRAFSGCYRLTSIDIPNSVTSIGSEAFRYCSDLTSIKVEEGNTTYDSRNNCNAIIKTATNKLIAGCQNTIIPNSVTNIGDYAFSRCSSLTSITIPNSVTIICTSAFSDCYSLTSITIPEGVTYIGDYAFSDCYSLTSITIPNSVTSIGRSAFYNCYSLTSITIPEGVTYIGDHAFSGCLFTHNAFVNNSTLTSSTNWGATLYDGLETPEGLIIIDGTAVKCRPKATSIIIPNNVTSISDNTFYGCGSLTSVTIGSGVLTIGNNAFNETSLKKVIWLTNTPPTGYSNVTGLINYVANNQYTYLSNVTVYPFLSSLFEVDGVKYVPVSPSERTCDAIDCAYNESAENINIGETVNYRGISLSVTQVKPYLCYGNTYIKETHVSFAGALPDYAFSNCPVLQTADLGEGITSIGSHAFRGCPILDGIVIPASVTSIGNSAFENCSSFTTIQIPQNVTTVGNNVFYGCNGLKTIQINDGEANLNLGSNGSNPLFANCPLDSVYIGRNITYPTASDKGYSPFYRNTTLRSVTITDKETEISTNEFYGCTNLKNVRIGNGVTTFGDWAFSGCSCLDYFSFGSSVETIGKEAFSDCTAMTSLISKAITPPTCGSQALDDINKWNCTLTVPQGYIAAYQQADQWKEFFFIDEGNGEEPPVIPDPKCAKPIISYTNGKLTYTCETEGVSYTSSIRDEDIRTYNTDEVDLGVTYIISVYASKIGYVDSDAATGILCWIDQQPSTEGIVAEDAVTEVKALPVLIQNNGGTITVQGANEGTEIMVYSVNGMKQGSTITTNGFATIKTSLQSGSTAIVKIGEKSIKVLIK